MHNHPNRELWSLVWAVRKYFRCRNIFRDALQEFNSQHAFRATTIWDFGRSTRPVELNLCLLSPPPWAAKFFSVEDVLLAAIARNKGEQRYRRLVLPALDSNRGFGPGSRTVDVSPQQYGDMVDRMLPDALQKARAIKTELDLIKARDLPAYREVFA